MRPDRVQQIVSIGHTGSRLVRQGPRRGVALITVVVVLMALVIIATPFSISMRHYSESATDLLHRTRAGKECEALRNIALDRLQETHPALDVETPFFDPPEEWALNLEEMDLGFSTSDPRGKIWSLKVEDLQGRINLNGVSIYLMANLLGERTRLETPLEKDVISMKVADTTGFPQEGFLWIEGEAVGYVSKGTETFNDIERAVKLEAIDGIDPALHPSGTEVLGYRSYLVATYPIQWNEGGFSTFPTKESVRNIATGNEVSLSRDTFDRIADFVTVRSGYPTGRRFVNPQRIVRMDRADPRLLFVEHGRYIGAGSIVRVRIGKIETYSMVLKAFRVAEEEKIWALFLQDPMPIDPDGDAAWNLDVLARPAVNINTAPLQVLEALVKGLALTPDGKKWVSAILAGKATDLTGFASMIQELPLGDLKALAADFEREVNAPGRTVTGADARRIAEAIRSVPVRDFAELYARLRQSDEDPDAPALSSDLIWAVMLNAVHSNDAYISGGTAPFCFSSEGCFQIDTAVSDNYEASGREKAHQFMRDTAWPAPSGRLLQVFASQLDFEAQRRLTREGRHYITLPDPMNPLDHGSIPAPLVPEPSDDVDAGALQLSPVRVPGLARCLHFDPADMRHFMEDRLSIAPQSGGSASEQAWQYPLGFRTGESVLYCRPDENPASLLDGPLDRLWPFSMEMWYRFDTTGKEHYLFDCGIPGDEINNRIYLFHDGEELIFRVADITLPSATPGSEEPMEYAEIRYDFNDLPLEEGVFYHFTCMAMGSKPCDLCLFVDGVPRGRRSFHTRLSRPLENAASSEDSVSSRLSSTTIYVDDARTFPNRGVVRIGKELIEYTSRKDDHFVVDPGATDPFGSRKSRASQGREHPEAQSVELYGYSVPLRSQQIPTGDLEIQSDIGPFVVAEVNMKAGGSELSNEISIMAPNPQYEPQIVGKGFYTDSRTSTLPLFAVGGTEIDKTGFSPDGGYAVAFTEFPMDQFTVHFEPKQQGLPPLAVSYEPDLIDSDRPETADDFLINNFSVFHYEQFTGTSLIQITWGAEDGYPNGFPLSFMDEEGAAAVAQSGASSGPYTPILTKKRCFVLEYSKDFEEVKFEEARVFVFPISVNVNAGGSDLAEQYHPAYDNPAEDRYRSQLLQLSLDFEQNEQTEWIRYDSIEDDLFCRDHLRNNELDRLRSFLSPEEKIDREQTIDYQEVVDRVNWEIAFRGQHGTKSTLHAAQTSKALPVFEVELHPTARPGRHDVITLVQVEPDSDLQPDPESAVINYSNAYGGEGSTPFQDRDRENCALIALRSGVMGTYKRTVLTYAELNGDDDEVLSKELIQRWSVESRDLTRIVKFPSGELPAKAPEELVLGGNLYGDPSPSPGCIDEVRFRGFDTPHRSLPKFLRFELERTLEPNEDDQLYLSAETVLHNHYRLRDPRLFDFEILKTLPQDAGLLLIGDELIAYTDVDAEDGILGVAPGGRGVFNTEPGYHYEGEWVVVLNFPVLSILAGNLTEKSAELALKSSSDLPFEGAVLVEKEVIGYSRNDREADLLLMPEAPDDAGFAPGAGLLRGRYGTIPARHLSGALVYSLPLRYRDRYLSLSAVSQGGFAHPGPAAVADLPEAAYFPLSLPAPDAFFHRISWMEERQGLGAWIELRARVGVGGGWRPLPLVEAGQFCFSRDNEGRDSFILNQRGDRLDLRIYTRYGLFAFDPLDFVSNAWKYAPLIKAVGVDYVQPSRIVRHEEWQ